MNSKPAKNERRGRYQITSEKRVAAVWPEAFANGLSAELIRVSFKNGNLKRFEIVRSDGLVQKISKADGCYIREGGERA